MSVIHFVTVPIGNYDDITIRALNHLKEVKYIFCEDTRVFKKLANALGIEIGDKFINSFHDHSDKAKLDNVFSILESSEITFVSDAGSPVISDPAYPLIVEATKREIEIKVVSGISAVTCALENSGLAPIPFSFHGFIPRDKGKKEEFFSKIEGIYGTHIFFEGVSRVMDTAKVLSKCLPSSNVVIARELTKEYESIYRFKASEFENIKDQIVEKGEFVFVVSNEKKSSGSSKKIKELANAILEKGSKPKLMSKLLAEILDLSSKEIYEKIQRD
ncbi:MAG: 16S rRNA (cytidine(1402)-2'-O)-methyltransferase [Bacteriovoracaceae bacterium]|jgi:16S rRNA (cytidine1402-2'-O)-methyltransferase|nr:16S rRNA (cytidine(1402)-2'-O)-methyltransferase [Bacteriovoracaceae bacterium]